MTRYHANLEVVAEQGRLPSPRLYSCWRVTYWLPDAHFVKEAATRSLIRLWFSLVAFTFAVAIYPLYIGIPTAAKTPMMATTINNSMRVKPRLIRFIPLALFPTPHRKFPCCHHSLVAVFCRYSLPPESFPTLVVMVKCHPPDALG